MVSRTSWPQDFIACYPDCRLSLRSSSVVSVVYAVPSHRHVVVEELIMKTWLAGDQYC